MTNRERLERRDVGASFALYGLGTAGLFVAEIMIGQRLSGQALSNWAFLRSAVFIGGSLATAGIDQALVRANAEPRKLIQGSILQVMLVSLPVGVLALLVIDASTALVAYLACASLSLCLISAGFYRSRFRIAESQVALHLWKFPFGVAVFVLVYAVGNHDVALLLVVILLPWAVTNAVRIWATPADPTATQTLRELYPVGTRFWLTSMIATSAIYLDQIVLNIDGESAASSQYFLYATVLLPLPTFVTGFAGNILNPYLRQEGDGIRDNITRKVGLVVLLGLATAVGGIAAGFLLGVLLGRFDDGTIWWLVAGLAAISCMRVIYVLPSAMLGVYATRQELTRLAAGSALSIASMVVVYPILRAFGMMPLAAILIAVMVATFGRLLHAGRIARSILMSDRHLELSLQ